MSKSPRLSGEDLAFIIAALVPAQIPEWWITYNELRAESDRWRDVARDFIDPAYGADRAEALAYADITEQPLRDYHRAWYLLLEVCRAATVTLPAPGCHYKSINPDEAAKGVREALEALSARQDEGAEWAPAGQALKRVASEGIEITYTDMNRGKADNEFMWRDGGAGVSYEVEFGDFKMWALKRFLRKKPNRRKTRLP